MRILPFVTRAGGLGRLSVGLVAGLVAAPPVTTLPARPPGRSWWFPFLVLGIVLCLALASQVAWLYWRSVRARRWRQKEREAKRRMLQARENERVRLARELHDGPVQDLYGVRLQLRALLDRHVSEEHRPAFQGELDSLRQIIAELRELCRDLRPPALAPRGLAAAIRSHVRRFEDLHPDVELHLDLMADHQSLPKMVRAGLYRVYQESLNNAGQHAEASHIRVRFELDFVSALLVVEDDGRGFELPDQWLDFARQGHFGLLGMRERADALGGELEIMSWPGYGTRIQIMVPLGGTETGETGIGCSDENLVDADVAGEVRTGEERTGENAAGESGVGESMRMGDLDDETEADQWRS